MDILPPNLESAYISSLPRIKSTIVSNLALPKHSYAKKGEYKVTLIVDVRQICRDTAEKTIRVFPKSKAEFDIEIDECKNSLSFYNVTIEANSYYWDFGDGNFSENDKAYHEYMDPARY